MTPDDYTDRWLADTEAAEAQRDRTVQTTQRLLGVSDLMHCREYARLFLAGHPFTDTPETSQSRAGTYYHAGILPAIAAQRPGSLVETELTVTLANGFEVIGHADLIEPDEPSVTDVKTVDGTLPAVRKTGASQQQQAQRNLYYAGAHQAGIVPAEGTVRNIWLDRSGTPERPHVEQEPYDPSWLDRSAYWLDDVYAHVENDTPASRDKDMFFCRTFCPFVTACRGEHATPEDEVDSDELAVAASLYREGAELEREGKALKKAAAATLSRLEGHTVTVQGGAGRFVHRSTWINPSSVEYERKGYHRLDIKEAS